MATTKHVYDFTKGFRIYLNLNKSKRNQRMYVWSIQAYVIGKGFRLYQHATSIIMYDVNLIVNQTGRARAIKQGVRNVHAFAVCNHIEINSSRNPSIQQVTYNPFRSDCFHIVNSNQSISHINTATVRSDSPYIHTNHI